MLFRSLRAHTALSGHPPTHTPALGQCTAVSRIATGVHRSIAPLGPASLKLAPITGPAHSQHSSAGVRRGLGNLLLTPESLARKDSWTQGRKALSAENCLSSCHTHTHTHTHTHSLFSIQIVHACARAHTHTHTHTHFFFSIQIALPDPVCSPALNTRRGGLVGGRRSAVLERTATRTFSRQSSS